MNIFECKLQFTKPLTPLNLGNVKTVIVHHAAASTCSIDDVHKWHVDRGWLGFGYSEMVRKNGDVYVGRGDNVGSHCLGYNDKSIGILCEGNYDTDKEMPEAQYQSLLARVKYHRDRLPGKANVMPHHALGSTACPGKFFPMLRLYADIAVPDETFVDITGHWAEKDILKAHELGLVKGRSAKRFEPNANITRAEVVAMLMRLHEKI